MRLATLIIIAPSAILFFMAGANFVEDLYGYGRFIAPGPGEWPSFHRICRVNANGPLGVARPDYQGATVPCICGPMSCLVSSTIEEVYQLRFGKDAMLAATASMFVAVFASQRQYLKKRGVFDKKPLSILAASALAVSLAVMSLFNRCIIIPDTTPVVLSNRMEHSDMPQIALSDKDTVLITWRGCTGGLYPNCENIFLVKSVDAGHIFADPVKISNSTWGGILDNKLLVNSSNLYSAWIGSTPGESYDIYFRKSDDRGDHFSDIIKLSANASTSTCGCTDSHPRMSLAGSNLYMTWQGSASVKTEDNKHASVEIVYLRESKDNGQTFGDLRQLSNSSSHSFEPNISASYNNVYVTWNELTGHSSIAKLLLRKSSNAGSSFGNEINLTESAGPRTKSVLFVSNNTVFVGWTDISSRIPRVVVRLSSDNGTEFTKAINLSNSSENSYPLQVAASDNGYLYVQWVAGGTDPKANKYDLYLLPIEISHQSYSSFPKYSLSLDGHEILVPWKMQYGVISNIEAEDQSRNITITFQKPLQQPDNLTIAVPRDFVYPPGNLNTIQYVQDFVVDANGKLIDYDKLQIDLEYNVIRIPVSSGTASVHIASAKAIPEVPVSSLLDLLGLSAAIALAFISLMKRNNGHRDYKLISEV